jgi:hypothetical protein
MEDSRAFYPFTGKIGDLDDPNHPIPLCRPCAARHHAHWDEMWEMYWSNRL